MTRLSIQCDVPDDVSLPELDPDNMAQEIVDAYNAARRDEYPEVDLVAAEWLI